MGFWAFGVLVPALFGADSQQSAQALIGSTGHKSNRSNRVVQIHLHAICVWRLLIITCPVCVSLQLVGHQPA